MKISEQFEDARTPGRWNLNEHHFKTCSKPANEAQVIERINAIWERLGTIAAEPDLALHRALERIKHTEDKAEVLKIGCGVLTNYDQGATLEFAELAQLTARAAAGHCSNDEVPTALRQAARQTLHTYLSTAELGGDVRARLTQQLRQIEQEQISSE